LIIDLGVSGQDQRLDGTLRTPVGRYVRVAAPLPATTKQKGGRNEECLGYLDADVGFILWPNGTSSFEDEMNSFSGVTEDSIHKLTTDVGVYFTACKHRDSEWLHHPSASVTPTPSFAGRLRWLHELFIYARALENGVDPNSSLNRGQGHQIIKDGMTWKGLVWLERPSHSPELQGS
jgi:hypothetical protein